jgi:hypothetical protein
VLALVQRRVVFLKRYDAFSTFLKYTSSIFPPGTLILHGRSRQIPGTNAYSGAGIWRFTGSSWLRIMNDTQYGISATSTSQRD